MRVITIDGIADLTPEQRRRLKILLGLTIRSITGVPGPVYVDYSPAEG